mgnify:CR=1 FL=1
MERKYMGASGQTLYLKMEQNCIVYERSVKLQDIASVECTDVGIRRQVLQEQIYHFYGNEKSSLRAGFFLFYILFRKFMKNIQIWKLKTLESRILSFVMCRILKRKQCSISKRRSCA